MVLESSARPPLCRELDLHHRLNVYHIPLCDRHGVGFSGRTAEVALSSKASPPSCTDMHPAPKVETHSHGVFITLLPPELQVPWLNDRDSAGAKGQTSVTRKLVSRITGSNSLTSSPCYMITARATGPLVGRQRWH